MGLLVAPAVAAQSTDPVWDSVGWVLQASGSASGGIRHYELPRSDLRVRVGGVELSPELPIGSWVGFGDSSAGGDLVVTSAELGAVLSELSAQRIQVTAVHNHLLGEQPRITYLHFHGEGSPVDLARRLDAVVSRTATPRGAPLIAAAPPIDTTEVFSALGQSGRARGSVAQLTFDLPPSGTPRGHADASAPGRGTISLQMVTADRAVATGDFAVLGDRVDPLLEALARNGITVTALQSRLLGSATLYYVHFWADSSLSSLLTGLRAAVDAAREE